MICGKALRWWEEDGGGGVVGGIAVGLGVRPGGESAGVGEEL